VQEKIQYLSIELWLALKTQERQLIKKVKVYNSSCCKFLMANNLKMLDIVDINTNAANDCLILWTKRWMPYDNLCSD